MPNPIMHFEIAVKDLKAGADFYKKLFGWKIKIDRKMNYGMIDTGGQPGGGMYQVEGKMKPGVTLYPEVENIEKMLAKAEKLGGKIVVKKTLISEEWGYFAIFADPDGTMIGLWAKS
jgi:uncharacterized protein